MEEKRIKLLLDGGIVKACLWNQRPRLTQKDLAKKVGISERYFSSLVTGDAAPTPELLEKIGNELDMPPDLLISGDYIAP